MDFSETVVVLQVDIDTPDTEIMEQVVWCTFGGKYIGPTVDRVTLFQIAQFLVQLADMLDATGFRQRLTIDRIEQLKDSGFEQ